MSLRRTKLSEHAAGIRTARATIHTNTVEGYFSIFKRGMKGVYQHCGEKHLHRYLAEFDFRYNNRVALGVDDAARATKALQGRVGKRLTYLVPEYRCGQVRNAKSASLFSLYLTSIEARGARFFDTSFGVRVFQLFFQIRLDQLANYLRLLTMRGK